MNNAWALSALWLGLALLATLVGERLDAPPNFLSRNESRIP
jgi:hypothetical protein